MTTLSNEPIVNLPFAYVNGMIGSQASNTTLSITSGQCRDSTNTVDIVVSSTATLNAAVNGLNGLDTGSLAASKMYAIYAIMDVTQSPQNPSGYILSLNASTPLLPFGYSNYRLIGWWPTDGSSHFLVGYVYGNGGSRMFNYDVAVSALSGGTSSTFAAIDLSNIVPAVDPTPVQALASFTPNAAGDKANFRPTGSSSTNGDVIISGVVAAKAQELQVNLLSKIATAKPEVDYKVAASGALDVLVTGFNYSL